MEEKKINRVLSVILILLPLFLLLALGYADKRPMVRPLRCGNELVIRTDSRGKGVFNAPRNGRRRHKGVDLSAAAGEPVYAARAGLVLRSGFHRGLGHYVEIRHHDGWVTIYGHLKRRLVKKGQMVGQGALIGEVGKSGNADHPAMSAHLHLELRDPKGVAVDPMRYLE
ncbi:MAG: M23 family metallopeptidase [Candidatus Omnitrophica bacterium]|nr:M23 family metallopeptidase [Candidatus Omnitrophota bacterium]